MDKKEVLYHLKKHLQIAIELEHATLPPYFCAYWSIHGQSEEAKEAAKLILSVAREEMLHLAMVCNILNAIGGYPSLNGREFIPDYPCELPGHSETVNPFIVHLDKCCPESIKTFLKIELPETSVHKKSKDGGWSCIAEFYEEIISLIQSPFLVDEDFMHGKQCSNQYNPAAGNLFTVNSREDAMNALVEILDQGEGWKKRGHYDDENELTHYWKFRKLLKQMDSEKWNYENEVLPIARDPDESLFTDEAQALNYSFNVAYSRMLDEMHAAFNSETPVLDKSIDAMFQLGNIAKELMRIPLKDNEGNCCPTFKYMKT